MCKPITAKGVASLLAPYGIKSHAARLDDDGRNHRYYFATDFEDAWSRYVAGPGTAVASAATVAQESAAGTAIVEIEQDYQRSAWGLDR